MSSEPISTRGSEAMVSLAKHYAEELDSQFRTLNYFVTHAGEIGRVHETFLRGMLTRFLPDYIRLSTGFVAHPQWTSRQQDILIHLRDSATLFKVGDCTVIDHDAFIGTIEVKTDLSSSKDVCDAVIVQAELRKHMRDMGNDNNRWHEHLYGIYAWDGLSFVKAISALWKYVREDPATNGRLIPDFLYVRGKYILMADIHGKLSHPPYRMWRVGDGGITEGEALLGVVYAIWEFGLKTDKPKPWWLLSWDDYMGPVFGKSEAVEWPEDLLSILPAN